MRANHDVTELRGRDPHAVLGVSHGARDHEVVSAYRRAARGGHPDAGGDASTFRQLTRARDVLLDPRRLAAYNVARQAAGMAPVGAGSAPNGRGAPNSAFASVHEPPSAGTRTATAPHPRTAPVTPRRSANGAGTDASPLAAIALVLVLLGPLAWPLAIVIGFLAMWQTGRSSRDGRSGVFGAVAVVALFVLPSLLAFALVLII